MRVLLLASPLFVALMSFFRKKNRCLLEGVPWVSGEYACSPPTGARYWICICGKIQVPVAVPVRALLDPGWLYQF